MCVSLDSVDRQEPRTDVPPPPQGNRGGENEKWQNDDDAEKSAIRNGNNDGAWNKDGTEKEERKDRTERWKGRTKCAKRGIERENRRALLTWWGGPLVIVRTMVSWAHIRIWVCNTVLLCHKCPAPGPETPLFLLKTMAAGKRNLPLNRTSERKTLGVAWPMSSGLKQQRSCISLVSALTSVSPSVVFLSHTYILWRRQKWRCRWVINNLWRQIPTEHIAHVSLQKIRRWGPDHEAVWPRCAPVVTQTDPPRLSRGAWRQPVSASLLWKKKNLDFFIWKEI